MLGPQEIERRFGSTAKSPDATVSSHDSLRELFVNLATALDAVTGEGHSKDQALIRLQEASMWAHKALADRWNEVQQERLRQQLPLEGCTCPWNNGKNNRYGHMFRCPYLKKTHSWDDLCNTGQTGHGHKDELLDDGES